MEIIYIHHIFYAADYTLIFILVCQWCKWISAMAMDSVLISHFLSFGKTDPAEIKNEVLLFVLGVGFGILVNLLLHKKTDYIEELKKQTAESNLKTERANLSRILGWKGIRITSGSLFFSLSTKFNFDNYYNFIYNYVMIVKNNLMSDLQQISDSHNSIITVEAAGEKNISRALLSLMAEDGRLNRIAKGIYTLPETIPDELYILTLFSDNIIFSHETALFCNGLSERTPFEHSYTLPQGKRLSSTFSKGFKSYYCKQELFNLGKITVKTAFGNEVPCYDAERTICDVIKDKNKMDPEVYLAALKMYSKSENKNLKNLSMYAEKMNIVKKVRSALEVIL